MRSIMVLKAKTYAGQKRQTFIYGVLSGTVCCIFYFGCLRLSKDSVSAPDEYSLPETETNVIEVVPIESPLERIRPSFDKNKSRVIDMDIYDDYVAKTKKKSIRVLCFVMTIPSKHKIIQEIRTAWGRSCTKIIFFSTAENTSSYIIGLGPNDDKPHDVAKGFQHIYNNYINESEWFLTATPDVFIFMENLRYFLATQNPDEPIRFGCREKISILSKEALIRYGKRTSTIKHCNVASVYKRYFSSSLDYCFRRIGIVSVNTKDKYGKRRVVCYDMQYFIYSLDTVDSQPMYSNRHGIRVTPLDVSDYAIVLTYLPREGLAVYNFTAYHLRPYGITKQTQDVNI